MKGFGGILVLFTILIISIILLSSTYPLKHKDNNDLIIPKINTFLSINEINLKNMSYDCNWQKGESTITNCLQSGADEIFDDAKYDTLISCKRTPFQKIDGNNYYMDLNCTNKLLLEKNTSFDIQKRITLTPPKP